MKQILCLWACLLAVSLGQAGSCPEACREVCGTEKSCCPAKSESCGAVQLERGGNPASAYSSKGGLRLR